MTALSDTYEAIENGFDLIISYAVLLIEFIGVTVLIISIIRGVIGLILKK